VLKNGKNEIEKELKKWYPKNRRHPDLHRVFG
jgi:hypothetical protein